MVVNQVCHPDAKLTRRLPYHQIQHERDAERRQAWAAAHNTPKPGASATQLELDAERRLRQEAELNVTRFRSEIQHQQSQLLQVQHERDELKRKQLQVESDLLGVAASDHTQQMAYPSSYPATAAMATPPRERLQESRVANSFVGGIRAVNGTPPASKPTPLPPAQSRRRMFE